MFACTSFSGFRESAGNSEKFGPRTTKRRDKGEFH